MSALPPNHAVGSMHSSVSFLTLLTALLTAYANRQSQEGRHGDVARSWHRQNREQSHRPALRDVQTDDLDRVRKYHRDVPGDQSRQKLGGKNRP